MQWYCETVSQNLWISRRDRVFRDYCFYELATTSSSYSKRPDFEIWDLKKKKNLQQKVGKIQQSSMKKEVGSLWHWSLWGHLALQFLPQWQLQPWDQSHHRLAQGVHHPHFGVSVLPLYASFPANSDDSPPGSAFPPSDGHPGLQPLRSSPITNGGIKMSPKEVREDQRARGPSGRNERARHTKETGRKGCGYMSGKVSGNAYIYLQRG